MISAWLRQISVVLLRLALSPWQPGQAHPARRSRVLLPRDSDASAGGDWSAEANGDARGGGSCRVRTTEGRVLMPRSGEWNSAPGHGSSLGDKTRNSPCLRRGHRRVGDQHRSTTRRHHVASGSAEERAVGSEDTSGRRATGVSELLSEDEWETPGEREGGDPPPGGRQTHVPSRPGGLGTGREPRPGESVWDDAPLTLASPPGTSLRPASQRPLVSHPRTSLRGCRSEHARRQPALRAQVGSSGQQKSD